MKAKREPRRRIAAEQMLAVLLLAYSLCLLVVLAWEARELQGGLWGQLRAVWLGEELYSRQGGNLADINKGWGRFWAVVATVCVDYALSLGALAAAMLLPRPGRVRAWACLGGGFCLLALAVLGATQMGTPAVWLIFVLPAAVYCTAAALQFRKMWERRRRAALAKEDGAAYEK